MLKNDKQAKRQKRVRSKLVGTGKRPRLCVFRSNKYLYAQLIDDVKGVTILSFSDKKLKKGLVEDKTKVEMAMMVGEEISKKAKVKKISTVIFDRGGYRYHGRVKAVAEGARKGGLKF